VGIQNDEAKILILEHLKINKKPKIMPNSIIYSTFVRDEQPNKGFKHNHQIIDQILKWT
jgi:hypothetical protein